MSGSSGGAIVLQNDGGGDRSETGDGARNSSHLAQSWALAECDDGEVVPFVVELW